MKSTLKQALTDLEYVDHVLGSLRFAGLDQNPKGIRDLLTSARFKIQAETGYKEQKK